LEISAALIKPWFSSESMSPPLLLKPRAPVDFERNKRDGMRNRSETLYCEAGLSKYLITNSRRNQTMSRYKPALHAFGFALILTGALSGCATYSPGDAKITSNVKAQLDQHSDLGAPNSIQVQTLDHVVYLNGMVSDGLESETAESVAREVPNVARVVNSVSVTH
jgi:hypothetical protein